MPQQEQQPSKLYSPQEFAAQVRKAVPGKYEGMSDDQVVRQVLSEHPEYRTGWVDLPPEKETEKHLRPGWPVTPKAGESTEQTVTRAREQVAAQGGSKGAQFTAATAAKDVFPYVAGGLATAALPETAPWWLSGLTGTAGAGAGNAAVDLVQGKVPQAGETLEAGIFKGALPDVTGRVTSKFLNSLYHPSPISTETRQFLDEHGIPLTAGERSEGIGTIATAERIGSQVAAAVGLTEKFQKNRMAGVGRLALNASEEITNALDLDENRSGIIVRRATELNPQELAQRVVDVVSGTTELTNRRLSGTSISPIEAADAVVQSIRGVYQGADAVEDQVYRTLAPQIDPVQVRRSNSANAALRLFKRDLAAKETGPSPFDPSLSSILGQMAGVKGIEEDGTIIASTPTTTFRTAWDNRQGLGKLIGRLDAQGVLTSTTKGSLDNLYAQLTNDMLGSLPPDLAAQFRQATNATRLMRRTFSNAVLKEMIREDRPVAAEKVFSTMMKTGNDQDVNLVMDLIGHDAHATDALRRGGIQWLLKNSADDEDALKLLDTRPSLKRVFGSSYNDVRQEIVQRIQAGLTEQQIKENAFLKKATGLTGPQDAAVKALESNDFAARLASITRSDPLVHRDIAMHMYKQMLDDSTRLIRPGSVSAARTKPPYGSPGSTFDPVEFSRLWTINRGKMRLFLAPETVQNLDRVSEAFSKLTFQSRPNIAATFRSLAEIGAVGMGVHNVLVGAMTGNWGQVGKGITIPLGAIYGPRVFVALVLSPKGSKLLAEGVNIPMKSPRAQAWMTRFIMAMGEEAFKYERSKRLGGVPHSDVELGALPPALQKRTPQDVQQ